MSQSEKNIAINSSKTPPLSTLAQQISTVTVARFLVELANLDCENPKAAFRFFKMYKSLLPSLNAAALAESEKGGVRARSISSPMAAGAVLMGAYAETQGIPSWMGPIMALAELLRNAWKQPTTLGRELRILGLLSDLLGLHTMRETSVESYNNDRLMMFMLRALHLAEKMRHCANPECPAPYFLAMRRSQKYCSETCALPAQREFKRAWWAEHGEQWRKKRETRPKKTQRKRGK